MFPPKLEIILPNMSQRIHALVVAHARAHTHTHTHIHTQHTHTNTHTHTHTHTRTHTRTYIPKYHKPPQIFEKYALRKLIN
jgi:hypothetical protein